MRSKYMRQFYATAMAGVMALSMVPTALAAEDESNTITLTGKYEAVDLAVTVPSDGDVIINPYGLPYQLDESTSISGQQITTAAPLTIENRSSVALSASVKTTGTVDSGSGFTFVDAASSITDSLTDKKGYVEFQVFKAAGITEDTITDTEVLNQTFAALKDEDVEGTAVVKATGSNSVADVITLNAGTADGELQNGGAAFVRLGGKVAKKAEWAATDTFKVKVAFTFEPTEYFYEAGTLSSTSTTVPTGSTGLPITLTPAEGVSIAAADWNWTISDTDHFSITKATSGTAIKATVKQKSGDDAPASGSKATVTVTGKDSNGLQYRSEIEVEVA